MRHAIRTAVLLVLVPVAAACSAPPPVGHSARVPAASPGGQASGAQAPGGQAPGDQASGGQASGGAAPGGAAPTLRGALTTPTDIDLEWRSGRSGAAGHVLEFATEAAGPYTVLRYLPPSTTTYHHPDLIPRTTFHYRLRAFHGPASTPVEVSLPAGELTPEDQEAGHAWLPPRRAPGRAAAGRSVRDASPAAAPSGLRAEVKHANGILFTWTDRASDESGFLLEARTAGASAYEPLVVLEPDTVSTGLITLPTEKRASYRIRAFTYGARSNAVRLTTGESTGRRAPDEGSERAN
ncbi:fibronectin type III domain-containing protein [Streptomyces sp. GMY02]|uniref:fibronectin type III domain-containing protein n=1 Tax=Streptomyces sp. GMY02 TaxID=1333528 RepID=UPI001C2C9595|nr:fibronectin type III domain-containing protein [Streptomyces sp. GMY02]QXE38353.1 fibronectin type III domain-containing protein [Streptomyces sp. GMY02]